MKSPGIQCQVAGNVVPSIWREHVSSSHGETEGLRKRPCSIAIWSHMDWHGIKLKSLM